MFCRFSNWREIATGNTQNLKKKLFKCWWSWQKGQVAWKTILAKVPFFHAHLMANQIDLRSTLGLDRRSSQWPFFHHQVATNRPSLYGIVRQLTGVKDNTNVPIMAKDGCLLLTESEQNLRWKEHFEEVLNQPEPLSTPDFEDIVMANSPEVYEGNINLEEVQSTCSQ